MSKTSFLLRLFSFIGVNKAIGYGVIARVWMSFAGFFTIILISNRFTMEQQGFYYAFSSLLAMQMFFELGLTSVIATFSSHEFSNLNWDDKGNVTGNLVSLRRFEELLCKSTQWFGIASILMILGLIPIGLLFFGNEHEGVVRFAWQWPWVLAVLGTALNLMAVPFFAIIMGSGDVATINHRGMVGGMMGSLLSWAVMLLDGGLYAIFAVTMGNALVSWTYLFLAKPTMLKTAYSGIFNRNNQTNSLSWRGEIWPLQWKTAITWVSGYFIFQLFNPILFYFHGPVVAGQMGMSLGLSNALLAISVVWMNAKVPEFGRLIALRDWINLDNIFFRVFYQSIGVSIFGAVMGWLCIYILQMNFQVGERLLPASQVALLFASTIILIISNGFATYLRAHKQEPLMTITIVTSILQGTSTLILGMKYSSIGVVWGNLLITLLFAMPAIYITWENHRKKWHCN